MGGTFRDRLLRRDRLIGTLVTLPAPAVAEVLALAGYDWLFIDLEHSTLDALQAQALLQAAGPCPCVVRVATNDEVSVKKALDIGPAGVIVPQVNTRADAERAVSYAKYPPVGHRSVGVARAHGYGLNLQQYFERANDEVSLIVQIEHIDGVNNVESIAGVPGIDALFVGPYDLSGSLGKPGKVTDPDVLSAIERVRAVAAGRGLPLGIFAPSAEAARPFLGRGFNLLTVGIDSLSLATAAGQALASLRRPE
jgi:2-dehydro-3-deoxyglucarate aldolase/4-hydroxy-2-oxoheptanedioate aldolase